MALIIKCIVRNMPGKRNLMPVWSYFKPFKIGCPEKESLIFKSHHLGPLHKVGSPDNGCLNLNQIFPFVFPFQFVMSLYK